MDHERNARLNEAQRYASTGIAGGMQGGLMKDPECESASRIRDGLSTGEERLSDVHAAIDALERRLDTVLSPTPPTPPTPAQTSNGVGPNVPGAHVTARVLMLNEGFAHAIVRLRDLTRRVEV